MKILSMPAGAASNPAIIITGDTINYACDATLAANAGYMRFSYPNNPNIYNIDMTGYDKISFTFKNGTSGGGLYVKIDGTNAGNIQSPNANTLYTGLINVSSYTGIHTVQLENSASSAIDISSMVLTN